MFEVFGDSTCDAEVRMIGELKNFQIKTRILFGKRSLSALGEVARETGARKYLLVADPALETAGYVA